MLHRVKYSWAINHAGQNGRQEQKVPNKGHVSHELCLHSHLISEFQCVHVCANSPCPHGSPHFWVAMVAVDST